MNPKLKNFNIFIYHHEPDSLLIFRRMFLMKSVGILTSVTFFEYCNIEIWQSLKVTKSHMGKRYMWNGRQTDRFSCKRGRTLTDVVSVFPFNHPLRSDHCWVQCSTEEEYPIIWESCYILLSSLTTYPSLWNQIFFIYFSQRIYHNGLNTWADYGSPVFFY